MKNLAETVIAFYRKQTELALSALADGNFYRIADFQIKPIVVEKRLFNHYFAVVFRKRAVIIAGDNIFQALLVAGKHRADADIARLVGIDFVAH